MTKLLEITGKAVSGEWGSDDSAGNGTPVLRTTNFTNEGVVDYSDVVTRDLGKKDLSEKYLRKGDIIIEKSGGSDKQPVGRVIYFEGPETTYVFNNFTGLLRVIDQQKWFPRYVFYALYANYKRGGTKAYENRTTGLHNLQIDAYIANTIIPDTDMQKQKRICAILDKVREAIGERRKQLDTLDQLIKARFVEMFGDPVTNEKGWKTKPLLSMGICKNGMNFHYDDSGVELNCLGVGDFKDYSIISDTTALPMVSLNEMPSSEYLLQDDDIVFVRSNGNKKMVGRSIAVYPGDIPTTFSGFCIRYRRTDNSVITPYLLRVLKAESMRQKMYGRGANIQNLNQQTLSSLDIPVPPREMQEQFAAFVSQVDKSKVAIQSSVDQLVTLKQSLMQKYFR